ncbi:hypothetical protein QF034_004270 [Streptomyces africanus]|uniref:Uncharacterized protein n=1 Tax=Streptomyces africanus TaxID=231024 RepID=A0ABU0QRL5_9ACTN|nr:hypothetical protein [Streptomyces africanus]
MGIRQWTGAGRTRASPSTPTGTPGASASTTTFRAVSEARPVGKIKNYMRVLELMGSRPPVIALLVAAAGVYTAFNRRHALIGAGPAVFVAMLVLGITLTVFRDVYLDHPPRGASPAAAGAVYDALVRFLRAGVRALGAVALVTAVGAFLDHADRCALTWARADTRSCSAGARRTSDVPRTGRRGCPAGPRTGPR